MTRAYSERFDRAVALAVRSFRSELRKCTSVPYITHLFSVCAKVGEHGGDEDQLIAAMLHDYVEDIPGATIEEVRSQFGDRVATMVDALSDCNGSPKPPWKERKSAYIAHLPGQPTSIKLISAADKLHNCSSILLDHKTMGDQVFDRFKPTKVQTLWYYRSVVTALSTNWDHPLLDELREAVDALHALPTQFEAAK